MPTVEQPTGAVELRVRNASDVDFDNVVVIFPEQHRVDYGRVAKGAGSRYERTRVAYRYAAFRITIQGRVLTLDPVDYVGEQPLEPGRHTYAVGVDGNRLTVTLEPAGP